MPGTAKQCYGVLHGMSLGTIPQQLANYSESVIMTAINMFPHFCNDNKR